MKARLPECLQGWEWPQAVLDAAVVMPRQLLAARVRRQRGDKAFVQEAVASAWVTSFAPRTTRLPRGKSAHCEDILVLHLELAAALSKAEVKRLHSLVHAAIPHPLLLMLSGQDELKLSFTPLLDGELQRREPMALSIPGDAAFLPPMLVELNRTAAPSLTWLYAFWQCALYAADIQQRLQELRKRDRQIPLAFQCMESPEAARDFLEAYCYQERLYSKAWVDFHKGPRKSPARMRELSLGWFQEQKAFLSFLSTHSIT